MTSVSLKVNVTKLGSVKTMMFPGSMTVQEVCKEIREKLGEESAGGTDHGIFYPDQGKWLEPGRTLDYYDLKTGDLVEYKKKHRPLRIKMLDDTVKTILVDESLVVVQLVVSVCGKIGITNPDEYSFTTESNEAKAAKPQDLKKSKTQDKLLESKAKTAETIWLNPDKSLREQGVDDNEVIVLKKKFFFSDQNIDRNDPIQLNLLYVQSQEAIVKGTHPCTQEEACQFAALQCQVQFGNHEPDRHKPGFLNLPDFLPPEYADIKEIDKKIFQEHRKLQGMTELNAKFRFVQLCRSLKTYGVTFFLVKEKVPKKNKMVKILLGVTRESVMRLDAETKEVLKVWSLTTLRRWAASPNSLTLDFGDYADSYYSVQTTEGDSISQLIAGYIDIILKRKKDAERMAAEEDTELAITEENLTAGQATAITMVPGRAGKASEVNVAGAGMLGSPDANDAMKRMSTSQQMQYFNASSGLQHAQTLGGNKFSGVDLSGATGAQQALLQQINSGFAAVNAAQSDLNVATSLPPMGNDPASVQWRKQTLDINKQNVTSQVAAHLAATAAVVNLTSVDPSKMDYNAIGSNISTISSNLSQLASGTKMVAALMDDPQESEKLLEAAKKLAAATAKLLTESQPIIVGQGNRQELLSAAQGVGGSSSQMLKHMGDPDVPLASQQELIELAKNVAAAMTKAVADAKTVAGKCPEQKSQQEVVAATKESASAATQLVTTTTVVAPTINNPLCQNELLNSAHIVEDAVSALMARGKAGCGDPAAIGDLANSIDLVKAALQKLIDKARLGGQREGDLSELERQAEIVMGATQSLLGALGDSAGIVQNAKSLAVASTQLVNALRQQAANESDPNEKARLLAAARALADATTKMVNAAKDAARNPNDPAAQARLRAAAEALQQATRDALGSDDRKKAFKKLLLASKAHAAATTQLIAASKTCSPSNRNQASQMQLINASKGVAENTGQMVNAIRALTDKPEDANAQLKLINAAKAALAPGQALIASAKAASPTIGDQAAQGQLLNFAKASTESLKKLKEAVDAAEAVSGSLEMDSAIDTIQATKANLQEAKGLAKKGALKPEPDQTAEGCQIELAATSKTIGSSMAQLISAATQGNENYTGVAARDTAAALGVLGQAVRGVAATSSDRELQDQALDQANEVLDKSEKLILASKDCLSDPQNPAHQQKLAQVAADVNKAMAGLVDSLPGQRDVNRALEHMKKELARMEVPAKAEPGETFQSAQNRLATAAAAVNVSANGLVTAAKGTPQQLKGAAENLDANFTQLVDAARAMAAQTNDPALKAELMNYVNDVHQSMSRLLQASKAYNADPNGPNLKNLLALAAKGVADALQRLLGVCQTAAPGQKECNEAQNSLSAAGSKLDAINDADPENNDSYFQALRKVVDNQQGLMTATAAIPAAARTNDSQGIGALAKAVADSVNNITDANVRAAYLVGTSDQSSVPAVPGIVDQQKFASAAQEVRDACEKLQDPNAKQQQILAAASVIAKNTAALCNACKAASAKTTNPVAKNQFVASAKTVAATTANLVTNIKALATQPNEENRLKCTDASKPLLDAVENLKVFASSPEFAATPAYISPVGQQRQAPLVKANKDLIESSKKLVETSKSLCANPNDAAQVQLFNAQQKALADSVKALVNNLKNGAPGQKECNDAIDKITSDIGDLSSASVKAAVGGLQPVPGPDHQGFKDALLNNARAVNSSAEVVSDAAQGNPETLGQSVNGLVDNFKPLVAAAIGAASKTNDQSLQAAILEKAKALGESLVDMLYAAKAAGGNPEADANIEKVMESRQKVNDSVKELIGALEGTGNETGVMNDVINNLETAIDDLQGNLIPDGLPFQAHATDTIQASKELADTVAEALAKAKNPEELSELARQVGNKYQKLVKSARGAAANAGDDEVKQGVLDSVRALGGSNVRLVDAMKQAAGNPNDPANRQKLGAGVRDVTQNVAKVVAAVKEGSKGLQICMQSIEQLEEIIADLDTAIVFASAGQLDPLDKSDNFNNYKEAILLSTKDLTNDVKSLVQGATTNQDQLGSASTQSVQTMSKLRDQIKSSAAAVTSGDRKGQEQLLSSCRIVAENLQGHTRASMDALGKGANEMNELRESAKRMVASISELLRVVKTVGDENTRAIRALNDSIAGIDAAIVVLDSPEPAQGTALPGDVVNAAKLVAATAASLVTASGSSNQDDMINAAGEARKNVEGLLRAGKAATANAPIDKKDGMHATVKTSANATKDLLEKLKVLQEKNTPANKAEVQKAAKAVAETVSNVVSSAGGLVPTGYVDPNDPNVIAERELLAAASSIEAAARKLAALQPPERPREANEDLPFEEQILEAAKAIAAATAALVRSATTAQREIIAKKGTAKGDEKKYFNDGTWSDGLVSAAKAVAACTGELCESANDSVQGKADREKVIAAAKGVSSSTMHLLSAAAVSSEANSESQTRLRAAGKTVTRATNTLVEAAEKSMAFEDTEKITNEMMKSGIGARKAEMDAQAEIFRIERELENARKKLGNIRSDKYKAGANK